MPPLRFSIQRLADGQGLYLRHAKSSRKDAGLAGQDRPLTGATDATADHVLEGAIAPELVPAYARDARWFDAVRRERRGR
jgi:hypothetical protein